jgi:HemY protein
MLVIVLIIAALIIGGLVGTLALRDPGYLMLSYDGHTIETSLWFALLAGIALWLLVRLLISLARSILGSGQLFGRWNARRRRFGSRRQTERGLLLMAEEEWADASKTLVAGAGRSDAPLLNYMQAAIASHELGRAQRRDELLQKAIDSTPGSAFAVQLAAARMQLGSGEEQAAVETLLALRKQAPRHHIVAELLARGYHAVENYSALESELPNLKRMRKEHPDVVLSFERSIGKHKTLGALAADGDAAGALATWRRLDKNVRLAPEVVEPLVTALRSEQAVATAGELLAEALADEWYAPWLATYIELPGIEEQQVRSAKSWLKSHSKDANVQLLAARLAATAGNWEKAREHAQQSDALAASAAARVELARCDAALGNAQEQDPAVESVPLHKAAS